MEQVVWGDVLFIVNFSMDFLALYITGRLLRLPPRTAALLISASVGGLYAVVSLFLSPPGNAGRIFSFAITAAVSLLMCYIVWGGSGAYIKSLFAFWTVSFALAGGMTALYAALGSWSERVELGGRARTLYGELPAGWLFVSAAASALVTLLGGRIIRRRAAVRGLDLRVSLCGATFDARALNDTGNLLRDPVGGLPVVIVSRDLLADRLPPDALALFDLANARLPSTDLRTLRRLRFIPASGVTGSSLLVALKPDSLLVNGAPAEALISPGPVSEPGFQAIANYELLRA